MENDEEVEDDDLIGDGKMEVLNQEDLIMEAKNFFNTQKKELGLSAKKGDKVVVTGFGTFMVRSRAARTGRNPQTGAEIQIPATKTPGFTAGKTLKRLIK